MFPKKQILFFCYFTTIIFLNVHICFSEELPGSTTLPQNKAVIDSLFHSSFEMIGVDNEIAKLYADKGMQLIKNIEYPEAKIKFYLLSGRIYYFEDNYKDAHIFLDSAKILLDLDESTKELAQYYFFKSSVYSVTGSYQRALEHLKESARVREILNDLAGIALCNNAIGQVYLNQNDSQFAESYFQEALAGSIDASDEVGQINTLMSFGLLKEQQDSLEKATSYFNRAYEIALKLRDLRRIAAALNRIGRNQVLRGFNFEAIDNLKEAGDIYSKLDEKFGLASIYNLLSMAYQGLQNTELALSFANKAHLLATQINSEPLIAEILLQLSKLYKANGQTNEALAWFEKYEKLNTRLISWEHNKKISNIEFESQLRSHEKDIEILSHKNRNTRLKNILLIVLIVVVGINAFLLIISLKLKNKNLSQKHEILEKKNNVFEKEKELHEKERIILENDFELQNKKLASKALVLLQLNETLTDIGKQIARLKEKLPLPDKAGLNEIEHEIRRVTRSNIWKEFNLAFNNVHNSFYDKLLKISPDLSSTEIKVAALLKLNLSTKEIAALTFKSESAVKSVKHRLKNKLQPQTDESLNSFLLKL